MSEDPKPKSARRKKSKGRTPEDVIAAKNRGGRAVRDWPALKVEWLKSGMTKSEFLTLKGINPKSGSTYDNTNSWTTELRDAHEKVTAAFLSSVGNERIPEIVEAIPEETSAKAWGEILRWRANQSKNDYQTADALRLHCKVILQNGMKKRRNEEGVMEHYSELSTTDLRGLATALRECQRIQRLSLGMSTDNVGVSMPDSNTEGEVDEGVPVFEIQMSQGGKFRTVRPRQVK